MKKYFKLSLLTLFIFLIGIVGVHAEENVELVKVELQEKSEYVIINEDVSLDVNKIKTNVNFYDEGDYVVYKLTVKNNDNQDYKIEEITDNNENEYLDFEYIYEGGIDANSEKEVLLKITYKSRLPYDSVLTPENTVNLNTSVNISIKLTDEIPVGDTENPSTFDKAHLYLILEIIGVVTLLVIFIKLKKKNAILLLLLAILLVPKSAKAKIELELKFSLENTIEAKVNFLSLNYKSLVYNSFPGVSYTKIDFIKSGSFPEEAIDVSKEQDESIKAWIEDGTLYIGSRYKIFIPTEYSSMSLSYFFNSNIEEINFNDRVDTTFVTNMSHMFASNYRLKKLDLSSFRTGNVTNMNNMFRGCSQIEEYDLSSFDTSNVTNMGSMFIGNNLLKKLDLSNFDTSKVTDVRYMFNECYNLEELIIDNWDFSKVNSVEYLFSYTPKLKAISAKNIVFPVSANNFFRNSSSSNDFVLESIDLTGADTSNTTSLYALFEDQHMLKEIKGMETWDTSKVNNISYMFCRVGVNSEEIELNFSSLDFSNVYNVEYLFYEFGKNSQVVKINADDINLSNLTSMNYTFDSIGKDAKEVIINISNWNLQSLTEIEEYNFARINAEKVIINAENWDVRSLTSAYNVFYGVVINSTKNAKINLKNWNTSSLTNLDSTFRNNHGGVDLLELDVTGWDTSKVTNMSNTFNYFGCLANGIVSIKGLETWDTSSVTNMGSMFYTLGRDAKKVNIDISSWDVSNVNSFRYMFAYSFTNAEEASIGNLSNWNIKSNASLAGMFSYTSMNSTAVLDIGKLVIYSDNIYDTFSYSAAIKFTLELHSPLTNYSYMFSGTSTIEGSGITIDYTPNVTNIDDIIATKSENSNITKGKLIEE